MTTAAPALRYAIYTRTLGGAARCSLADQRAVCRAYIASRSDAGWVALPGRYSDRRSVSPGNGFPALQRMLVQVERGRIDHLVIDQLSCICTAANDLNRIMMVLDYGRCSLVVARQGIDGATLSGRQVLFTLNALAPFIDNPGIRGRIAADQKRAVAALIRLRAFQTHQARAHIQKGQPPCGS